MSSPSYPPPPKPRGYQTPEDENASAGFAAVTATCVALAGTFLISPRPATEYLLELGAMPTNIDQEQLMGVLAANLLAGGSAAWACKGYADEAALESPTAERLQIGLMGMAAASLASHVYHWNDLTNKGLGAGAAVTALTFGVPAITMLSNERGRRRLGDRLGGAFNAVGKLFTFRRGFKVSTLLYAALTPVFFGAGVAYAFAPGWTLTNIMGYVTKGRDATFLWRTVAGALSVLPSITYSLKEKADNDELNDRAARTLNTGLLLASIGHLNVLAPILADGNGGKYLNAAVGVWAASAAASLVGLASSATDSGA